MADAEEAGNIDAFNLAVAAIFEYFLSQFPIKQSLPLSYLTKQLDPVIEICKESRQLGLREFVSGESYIRNSNIPPKTYLREITDWLQLEGFLHEFKYERAASEYQLTSKALVVLNATPSGLDRPLRVKLGEAIKGAGTAAGKSTISTIVGHIIGAAARSFAGV